MQSQRSGNYFDILALDVDKSPRIINHHNHNLKQGQFRNETESETESETACLYAACDFKTLLRVLVKHEIFNDNKHIMASSADLHESSCVLQVERGLAGRSHVSWLHEWIGIAVVAEHVLVGILVDNNYGTVKEKGGPHGGSKH